MSEFKQVESLILGDVHLAYGDAGPADGLLYLAVSADRSVEMTGWAEAALDYSRALQLHDRLAAALGLPDLAALVTIPGTDKQVSREKLVELGLLSAEVAELETQWVHAGAKDSYDAVAKVLHRRADLLRELGVLR